MTALLLELVDSLEHEIINESEISLALENLSDFLYNSSLESPDILIEARNSGLFDVYLQILLSNYAEDLDTFINLMNCLSISCGYDIYNPEESNFYEENIIKLGSLHVCKTIINYYNTHNHFNNNDKYIISIFNSIRSLSYNNEVNTNIFYDNNICELLSVALITYELNENIITSICWAIMSISYHDKYVYKFNDTNICISLLQLLIRKVITDSGK